MPNLFWLPSSCMTHKTVRWLQQLFTCCYTTRIAYLDPVHHILGNSTSSGYQELYNVTEVVNTRCSGQNTCSSVVPLKYVGTMTHQHPQDVQGVVSCQLLHLIQLLLTQIPTPQSPVNQSQLSIQFTSTNRKPVLLPEVSMSIANSVMAMVATMEHCSHSIAIFQLQFSLRVLHTKWIVNDTLIFDRQIPEARL